MKTVQEQGLTFVESISATQIAHAVKRVAECINHDYQGREPLFVCVLNGAFIFAADLFRQISLHSRIAFVRLKSYSGTASTGEVRELVELNEDISGRDIIVIEDIVDTGYSMHYYKQHLLNKGARTVEICTFLFKPTALLCPDAKPKYVGMEIPKEFIVGYGLDLDDYCRNLDAIYTLQK